MNHFRISDHQKVGSVKLEKNYNKKKDLINMNANCCWKYFTQGITEVKSLKGLRLLMQMHRDNEGMENYNSNLNHRCLSHARNFSSSKNTIV